MQAYRLEKNPVINTMKPSTQLVECPKPLEVPGFKTTVSRQLLRRWRRRGITSSMQATGNGIMKIGV
ncbi:MAG: hypothetical protein ACOH5I_17600 [Oligoflexus sp.]